MWSSSPPLLRIVLPSAAAAAAAAAAATATATISLPFFPLSHADAATATATAAASIDTIVSSSSDPQDESILVTNWSATHEVSVPSSRYFQPESLSQIQSIVDTAQSRGLSLRPSGSALSPNGLGLSEHGMLSLALYDGIVSVDRAKMRVRVRAGTRVSEVVEALKPYGLTLQNYASIKEQQIGGFTQAGAHGTGAGIPPVDEQVTRLQIVTPSCGTLELDESDGEAFYLARCGLGMLGVVTEVELKVVPAHRLVERTQVLKRSEVMEKHQALIQENQHVRFMWMPSMDAVVIVTCNPLPLGERERADLEEKAGKIALDKDIEVKTTLPLRELLAQAQNIDPDHQEIVSKSFAQLRDLLLAVDPLNPQWVRRVNAAETEYWKALSAFGLRVGWSHELLGFECGGQQWVSEVCFPAGTLDKPNGNDMEFMKELLALIDSENIPAPGPIEQRWTCGSRSPMSVSHGSPGDLFSWVGIIMYLPFEEPLPRQRVTNAFMRYRGAAMQSLWSKYGALEHWAKVETPSDAPEKHSLSDRMHQRLGLDAFKKLRSAWDPKGILSTDLTKSVFE